MARSSNNTILLVGLGGLLLALNGVGLLLQKQDNVPWFVAIALAQGIVYLLAVWIVCRAGPRRELLWTVLLFAALLRLSVLFVPPALSDDIYRYVWDGRVQAAGINPYKFVPADRELAPLRDQAIYPRINRREYAHTIYPPLAQMIFYGVTRVSESVTWMKAAMVAFEVVAVLGLTRLLALLGVPAQRVLIYAWHPLAIWEFAGSGHIDAAAVALIVLALWMRKRNSPVLTGIALAGATLVKIFPVVLFPALYRKWDWKMPAAFFATIGFAYLPYLGVGTGALGFLPGYLQEEGLKEGWGIFLLNLVEWLRPAWHLDGAGYLFVAAAALLALGLWLGLRRSANHPNSRKDGVCRGPREANAYIAAAITLATAFMVLLSPHYPWYFLWVVPMLCLQPYVPTLYLTVISFILYGTRLQAPGPVLFRLNAMVYLPFALLIAIDLLLRYRVAAQRGHAAIREIPERIEVPPAARGNRAALPYFERADPELKGIVKTDPVCLYLETTNRCNLKCEICPRTFEELEPPADMSWELFTKIVDQFPRIERVVLHGVGEPMMVRELPQMIRYLKERSAYVLFNTNGTLLTLQKGRELADSGLDELRVSLDAADAAAFRMVRGSDQFDRIATNIRAFTSMQRETNAAKPLVSLWLTGLKETMAQLPAFVRLAHELGVAEVYLQRLVYFPEGQGLARGESSLFERSNEEELHLIRKAGELARRLGIKFNASGATEPGTSLQRKDSKQPWSLCRRPWTLMYLTAHGRALPCCIAPFSMRGYDSFTLGDATRQSLREIWNGESYQGFRRALLSERPHPVCASCGLRWSL